MIVASDHGPRMTNVQATSGEYLQWSPLDPVHVLGVWSDTRWHFRSQPARQLTVGSWVMLREPDGLGNPYRLVQVQRVWSSGQERAT